MTATFFANPIGNLIAYINITDTSLHTYLTDEFVPYQGSYKGINIVRLGLAHPPLKSYSVYIYNNENQTLTVQPISNIVDDGSLPDMNLVPSYTIVAGLDNTQAFPFNSYPVEYLSLNLSFATAPTGLSNSAFPQGVFALLYIYY